MEQANKLLNIIKQESIGIYLFAFLVPLNPKWLGYGILIIVVEQLIKRNFTLFSNYTKLLNLKSASLWLVFLYLMHFVGMTYSQNTSFGWMDIGMKASFIIFPLIFIIFRFKINQLFLFKSFISGALLGALVCFYLSYLNYLESGATIHFSESYLSHFMHRSYWATYLVLAFSFSVYLVVKKHINILIGSILSLLFFVIVFMTGSKMGILIMVIITIALLIYIANVMGKLKWAIGLGILASLTLISTLSYFPSVVNRIESSYKYATGKYSIDVEKTESTASRILMWETAVELIKEKPLLGYGTGDVKDVLAQKNKEKGNVDVAQRKMNAHNQFLNSWVALGLFGLLFLVLIFLLPFIFAPQTESFIHRLIIFILFASLISESFLETQAGIIPVAFFMTLLGVRKKRLN